MSNIISEYLRTNIGSSLRLTNENEMFFALKEIGVPDEFIMGVIERYPYGMELYFSHESGNMVMEKADPIPYGIEIQDTVSLSDIVDGKKEEQDLQISDFPISYLFA